MNAISDYAQFIRVRTILIQLRFREALDESKLHALGALRSARGYMKFCSRMPALSISAKAHAYSRASASIGSSFDALRAGRKPNATPIAVEQAKAITIDARE